MDHAKVAWPERTLGVELLNKSALLGLAGAAVLIAAALIVHARKSNSQPQPNDTHRPAQIAAEMPAPAESSADLVPQPAEPQPATESPIESETPATESTSPPQAQPTIAPAEAAPAESQPIIAPAESRPSDAPAEPGELAAVTDEPEPQSSPVERPSEAVAKPSPPPIVPPAEALAEPGQQPEYRPDDPDLVTPAVPSVSETKAETPATSEAVAAADGGSPQPTENPAPESASWSKQWLGLVEEHNARKSHDEPAPAEPPAAGQTKPALTPPPAMHTIDGIGGGLITPTAYLVNPGPAEKALGAPAVSLRFWRFGDKDIETLAVSETFFGRIELSYAASRFGLGSFRDAVRKTTGRDIVRNEAYLHTISLRGLLLEENAFDLAFLPAVTAGVQFKYNDSIQTIDRRSGRLLHSAGLEKSNGIDWTITTSKTFRDPLLGKPLSISAGLRVSKAAQIGLLGFGNQCKMSLETNIRYQPTDWLIVGYELRDKVGPYATGPGTLGSEGPWQAISASVLLEEHLILTGAWTMMGDVANGPADCGWTIGLQYNF